jgi:hypothetical protein
MAKGRPGRTRGGLVIISELSKKRQLSARHQRRKAEKLAKKHPAEVKRVLDQLESRHDK